MIFIAGLGLYLCVQRLGLGLGTSGLGLGLGTTGLGLELPGLDYITGSNSTPSHPDNPK